MRRTDHILCRLFVYMLAILLFGGCQPKAPLPPEPTELPHDVRAVELGKKLFAFIKHHQHEWAVIGLRESLEEVNLEDCKSSFLEEGSTEADWQLLLEASKNPEFENGLRYAEKLKAEKILDVDIVEYMKSTLRNAGDASKLGFSAGFISNFAERNRALNHLHTLWIWAMPSE